MAVIRGYGSFGDWIEATTSSDTIYGYSGNDTIFGDAGADTIYGGDDFDYIDGGSGSDSIYGGNQGDTIYGMSGADYIDGGSGADTLWGGSETDTILGGSENDWISGGQGGDWLTGGSGSDQFHFRIGDTGLTWSTADTITDFNRAYDWIDASAAGTSANYREGYVAYDAGFNVAKDLAAYNISLHGSRYIFVSDGVDGYLFGDLNGDRVIDSGMELLGLDNMNDFTYTDII